MESSIEFHAFIELLKSLENAGTSIRLRTTGDPWLDFSSVILLSENAMMIQENGTHKIIMNLRNIVEFEIDKPHLQYAPACLYSVTY